MIRRLVKSYCLFVVRVNPNVIGYCEASFSFSQVKTELLKNGNVILWQKLHSSVHILVIHRLVLSLLILPHHTHTLIMTNDIIPLGGLHRSIPPS